MKLIALLIPALLGLVNSSHSHSECASASSSDNIYQWCQMNASPPSLQATGSFEGCSGNVHRVQPESGQTLRKHYFEYKVYGISFYCAPESFLVQESNTFLCESKSDGTTCEPNISLQGDIYSQTNQNSCYRDDLIGSGSIKDITFKVTDSSQWTVLERVAAWAQTC